MPLLRESHLVLLVHWLAQEAGPNLVATLSWQLQARSPAWAPDPSCLLRGFIYGLVCVCEASGMGRANWLSSPPPRVYFLGPNSNPVLSGPSSIAPPTEWLSHRPGTLLLQPAPPFQKTIYPLRSDLCSRRSPPVSKLSSYYRTANFQMARMTLTPARQCASLRAGTADCLVPQSDTKKQVSKLSTGKTI